MHKKKSNQNPRRSTRIFKVLGFDDYDRFNSGETSSTEEKEDAETTVNASTSDYSKPPFIATYLVGAEGVDLTPNESHYTTAQCSSNTVNGDVHRSEGPRTTALLVLESTAIQSSRVAVEQRATLTSQSHITAAGWYMFAMLLPVLNFFVHSSTCPHYSPVRSIANSFAVLYHQARTQYSSLSATFTGLLQNHLATQYIAAALDVILCVYALCYLVLSVYR